MCLANLDLNDFFLSCTRVCHEMKGKMSLSNTPLIQLFSFIHYNKTLRMEVEKN